MSKRLQVCLTDRYLRYTILTLVLALLCFRILSPKADAVIEVGVQPGDWVEYELDWDNHPPIAHAIWTRREILNVTGTVLKVNVTWQWYSNRTYTSKVEEGDLLTGGGEAAAGIFIPANLEEGDRVEIRGFGSQIINGTAQRVYLGVERTVVWSEFTDKDMHILVYWDREKGTALETRNTTSSFDVTTTVKDVSPDFWGNINSPANYFLQNLAIFMSIAAILSIAFIIRYRHGSSKRKTRTRGEH